MSQLSGKSVLVLGGSKGLGLATAQQLALQQATVTIVARSEPKEPVSNSTFVQADLNTIKGCKDLADKLKTSKFDTVFACAGIFSRSTLTRTSEGIEEDLQVSYLSRFVLLNALLDNGCIVGRKRVFIFGYPGQGLKPDNDFDDINWEKTSYKRIAAHMNTVVLNEVSALFIFTMFC